MKKGKALITIGLLLIAAALGLIGYNLWTTYAAGKAAADEENKLAEIIGDVSKDADEVEYPDYVLNPEMDLPVVTVDGREYVGILEIPALGLNFSVLNEWNYTNLRISPCKYASTPYLGGFVICAHNYQTHFGQIKNLSAGDEVRFTDADGNVFTYSVVGVEILNPYDSEEMKNSDWDLTLFTCTIGGATRVTVRCELCGTGFSGDMK